jgi:hypothetical protein
VRRAFSLGCALLAGGLAACQQTWKLDNLGADGSAAGAGGKSGGGKGGSGATDASTDARCFGTQTQIFAASDRPLVVVALDRSSEMTGTQLTGSNNSQFSEAVTDLSAQVGSYAPSGQHMSHPPMDFAYLAFPQGTTCMTQGCCAGTADFADSYSAFKAATMSCGSPSNGCGPSTTHPLYQALMNASYFFQYGNGGSQAQERYVLVVTDDVPDGNCSSENDCQAAQDMVYELSNSMGITTVVVFVGTSSNSCFPNFATVQGGPPAYYGDPNLYYTAMNADELQSRISTAIQAMASGACHFTLYSTPSSPGNLVVSQGIGTTPIPQDPKNGWTYEPGGSAGPHLTLHGSACSNYVQNVGGLQILDGCGTSRGGNP